MHSISQRSVSQLDCLDELLHYLVAKFGEQTNWGKPMKPNDKSRSRRTSSNSSSKQSPNLPLLQAAVECSAILKTVLEACRRAKNKGLLRQKTTSDYSIDRKFDSSIVNSNLRSRSLRNMHSVREYSREGPSSSSSLINLEKARKMLSDVSPGLIAMRNIADGIAPASSAS